VDGVSDAPQGERLIGRPKIRGLGVLAASLVVAAYASPAQASSLEELSIGNGTGNAALGAEFDGISADGTRAFFDSAEKITADDTDANPDVFERTNGVTTRLSFGPTGGNGSSDASFKGVSDDGKHVFFQSAELLVTGDADGRCYVEAGLYLACPDVYERFNGTTSLVSTGPSANNGSFAARYRGMSKDGLHAFFSTNEKLVAADTDNAIDVYERYNGTTGLVSTGPASLNSDFDAYYKGCSDDGSHVFFQSAEQLTTGDTDSEPDVYDRSNGNTTTLLSTAPTGGNGAFGSALRGAADNGSHVFFETEERLTSADTDSSNDVYDRSGGTTTLVSTGPAGGNGAIDAFFSDSSDNGAVAWFETNESLVAGDTDGKQDVYQRSGGSTTLVSTGPSGGSGSFDASFQSASADGSRVWIGTFERLAPTDTDSTFDVYERSGGTTTQLSTGPAGGNGAADAFFAGAVPDGSKVFFETMESLVTTDTDAYLDLYQRSQGATTLVSTGPNGAPTTYSNFLTTNNNGSRIFFETGDQLLTSDTDMSTDIYASTESVGYVRPRGATPMLLPLVIAYRDCTSANRVHGAPLANPSCNPPIPESNWLTVGTPDANNLPVKSIGSVLLRAVVGNGGTTANEADVRLALSVTDVRNKAGLGDYAGQLQVNLGLRITDKLNGEAPIDPGTVQDTPFTFTGTCMPTSDTTVGSTCTANTAANALIPGVITEGKRTIWQVESVNVYDGGSDGDVSTAPNTVFERQGVFVP
jgi:hypothetical protein